MRKRKIIIIVLLALLLGGVGVLFLSRNSEPAVEVLGNLSAQDVAQIKSAMRRHLWHEAFPNFSMQTIKALPGAVKRAWTTRITVILGEGSIATAFVGTNTISRNNIWFGYGVMKGSSGWGFSKLEEFSMMTVHPATVNDVIKTN